MIRIIMFLFVCLFPFTANAAFFDTGYSTFDTESGLEWLDLSATKGQSYNSIIGGYGGYIDNGWTYALKSQLEDLFDHAGGDVIGDYSHKNYEEYSVPAAYLGTALGWSYAFDSSKYFGWGAGKLGDVYSSGKHWVSIFQSNYNQNGVLVSYWTYVKDDENVSGDGAGGYYDGSFLIREYVGSQQLPIIEVPVDLPYITAVPLPASLPIFAAGLAVLAWVRQRRGTNRI